MAFPFSGGRGEQPAWVGCKWEVRVVGKKRRFDFGKGAVGRDEVESELGPLLVVVNTDGLEAANSFQEYVIALFKVNALNMSTGLKDEI